MLRHIASGKAIAILNEPSEIPSRVKMCVQSAITAGSFFSLVPIFKVGTAQPGSFFPSLVCIIDIAHAHLPPPVFTLADGHQPVHHLTINANDYYC